MSDRIFTVYYRRADGKGTQIFMSGLRREESTQIARRFFDRNPAVTMCWVLDDAAKMLGEPQTRDE